MDFASIQLLLMNQIFIEYNLAELRQRLVELWIRSYISDIEHFSGVFFEEEESRHGEENEYSFTFHFFLSFNRVALSSIPCHI